MIATLDLQIAAEARTPLHLVAEDERTRQTVLPVVVAPGRYSLVTLQIGVISVVSGYPRDGHVLPGWRIEATSWPTPPLVGEHHTTPLAIAEAIALAEWWETPIRLQYSGGSTPGGWRSVVVRRLAGTGIETVTNQGPRKLTLEKITAAEGLAWQRSGHPGRAA